MNTDDTNQISGTPFDKSDSKKSMFKNQIQG